MALLSEVLPPLSAAFPTDILPLPAGLLLIDRDQPLVAMDDGEFEIVLDKLREAAAESVKPFLPGYHNPEDHFGFVLANVRVLLPKDTDRAIRQAVELAAAAHDYAHQGSTFRAQAPRGMPLPELGTEIATEAVTTILVDERLVEYGVNEGLRLVTDELILASAFARPGIGPRTEWERILCCADVGPVPGSSGIIEWLDQGILVTFKEVPAKPAPTTFTGWVKNRMGFLGFYLKNFTTPGNPMYVPAAEELGWGRLWDRYIGELQAVLDGSNLELAERMKAQLRAAGAQVDLDA